jgi:hypothetical protein
MSKLGNGKDLLAQVIEICRISAALDQVDEELNKGNITSREADRRKRELQEQSKDLEAAIIKQRVRAPAPKPQPGNPPPGERMTSMLTDEEITCQAYALWEDRGRPLGSPDEDWYKAKEQLRAGAR